MTDTDRKSHTLFHAIKHGDLESTRIALQNGANANARDEDGWHTLVWAALVGNHEIVSLLEDSGAEHM